LVAFLCSDGDPNVDHFSLDKRNLLAYAAASVYRIHITSGIAHRSLPNQEDKEMKYEMTRRDLLKAGVMGGTALGIARSLGPMSNTAFGATGPASSELAGWKPGSPIGYINPNIPNFQLNTFKGKRYEVTVPDTLDLAERASVAVNGLTETTYEPANYEVYSVFSPLSNPPSMTLLCWMEPWEEGWIEATARNRLMSGSEQNVHVDQRWMEVALKLQGPDGLLYTPLKGRPWALDGFQVPKSTAIKYSAGTQVLQPYLCGCMLRTLAVYAKKDPNGPWKESARRLIDGLNDLAVVDGEYAYFWPSVFNAAKNKPVRPPMPTTPFDGEGTNIVLGLAMASRVLGYEPGLRLTKQMINYMRKNFYGEDGSFYSQPGLEIHAHAGLHQRGLLGMEIYAEAADDKEVMQFVVRSFERSLLLGANTTNPPGDEDPLVLTPGDELVGFYPEGTSSTFWETCETDAVGDMVAIATRLSEAGQGDFWDDADRRVRNQFAENQLLEIDWIDEVSQKGSVAKTTYNTSIDRVAQRIRGGFAGNASANDWCGYGIQSGIGSCCTAYGCNGLYWVWEQVLRYREGQLKVNLLLNRASRWADVDSYIPYQGRVEVKIKEPVDLSVRIPEWVKPRETRCQVNGQDRSLGWDGRYAKIGSAKPGDVAKLTFPISEHTDKIWIEKREYTVVRKGNDVVSIDPPGVYHPLYQRQHYRKDEPRVRKVTRFISDETL